MKYRISSKLLIAFLLLTASLTELTFATGALFCRPRFSTTSYNKMWIKKIDVNVEIRDQIAVTHVDQTFNNTLSSSVEAIYVFPLPANASITELIYWVNGIRYVAEIRESQQAINLYNGQLQQWLDPALLQYLGNNLFRLSIVPIAANSDVRTEVTYVEPITYDLGKSFYEFGLNTFELSSQPLQSVLVNVDAVSQIPYKKFFSPSHQNSTGAQLTKISDNHYKFFYGDENFYPSNDLAIQFETRRDSIGMSVLSYKPKVQDSIGTDNFYTLWLSPPDTLGTNEVINKDIVFTADVSSSMDGLRMTQIKQSLNVFLDLLNQNDRFNIVTFGTFVKSFRPNLVQASQANIDSAKQFVYELYALGLTNIDQALRSSLAQSYYDSTSNNLVFFTDGFPTWGDTVTSNILNTVQQNNIKNVRIFSFGVGTEVSKPFLQKLAEQNHGLSKFITTNDSIAIIINDHFIRISKPVLTNIEITLGGLPAFDQYPKIIPDLFWGTQLKQLGLYTGGGNYVVKVKGKIHNQPVEMTQNVYFTDTLGGHRFVPRLWAIEKINYLMMLIDTYGETPELKQQVLALSLRFQILTKYTAFYSNPNGTDGDNVKNLAVNRDFVLHQNYPNPFNPATRISFSVPGHVSHAHVVLKIYNLLGQLVMILADGDYTPGDYSFNWDGTYASGISVPTGIYFYTLQVGGTRIVKKMLYLK
ncbi:MAG: VWA domain-containing protein [Ignavibacteriales bacterium]|nr:VWA domain-containing protein [Ignavibacteriales bacterium]